MTRTYSAAAGPNVPRPWRERRDRLLALLRDEDERTAVDLRDAMIAAGEPHYNLGLVRKDLVQLERYALARSIGHPHRWSARP